MTAPDFDTLHIQAATFRRLVQHLMLERPDVPDNDLMAVAGFGRNRLADWYLEASEARGITMTRDEALEAVYGMRYGQWQAQHQRAPRPPPPPASRDPE